MHPYSSSSSSSSSPDGPRSEASNPPVALLVSVGPIGENRLWRWLRWRKDRRCLLEADARLLVDAGLTREDVLRGVPFGPVPAPRSPGSQGCERSDGSRMRRSGLLTGRGWQVKLYLSDDPRALGAGDANAAARAFRACLADPGGGPALGFAVLRYCLGEERAPEGSLALVVWSWAGQVLHRVGILLPFATGPVQRLPGCLLSGPEVELLARESHSWTRHVTGAVCPDAHAYLAEDCA